MEIEQREQSGAKQHDTVQAAQGSSEVVPGAPVVRSNTPRPFIFERGMIPGSTTGQPGLHFPTKAPSAPPLPEEVGEGPFPPVPANTSRPVGEEAQDFGWLFEYGSEMDPDTLNSVERLNGLALLYGPAVLKGYMLLCGSVQAGREGPGQPLATIVPASGPGAEVWGVLYRIPRRLLEHTENEPAILDMTHFASPVYNLFRSISLVVREGYRGRDVNCVAYVASDQVLRQASLAPPAQSSAQPLVQHLARIARQQKLPDTYLNLNEAPKEAPPTQPQVMYAPLAAPRPAQDTEPLRVIKGKRATAALATNQPTARPVAEVPPVSPSRWLIVLSLYLITMLLSVLTFAVLQGLGIIPLTLNSHFALLGVPYLVVIYGLLGGCVSSLFSLARSRRVRPPLFVSLTGFARPFVGGVLALISYQLLSSGAFVLNPHNEQQQPVFLLAGALAGLCESWLFFRAR